MKTRRIGDHIAQDSTSTNTSYHNMDGLFRLFEDSISSQDIEIAEAIIQQIESNPDTAHEIFYELTEENINSRSQVFLSIFNKHTEFAFKIIENLPEGSYETFNDDVLVPCPTDIQVALFEIILVSEYFQLNQSDLNILLLLFTNTNYPSILHELSDKTIRLLSSHLSGYLLHEKTISTGLINVYRKIGFRTFLILTQRIEKNKIIDFIRTKALDVCQVQQLKGLINEYIDIILINSNDSKSIFTNLLKEIPEDRVSEIIDEYLEYLGHIASENAYHVFSDKSGLFAELLPPLFELIFYKNRKIAYKILRSTKGRHKEFSQVIFRNLSRESKKHILERLLIENTQGDQRTKIELAEILVYTKEQDIINHLSIDSLYKLFIHFTRDYYDIDNTSVRADILIGFEHTISGLSPDKLKTVLSRITSKNFISFFRNIPICREVLDLLVEENKNIHREKSQEDALEYPFGMSKKSVETLAWLKKQNLKKPVTTIDIIDTLETTLYNYLSELRTHSDVVSTNKGKESMDMLFSKIIDTYFTWFKYAASLEQSALWYEFYMRIQQFRQNTEDMQFGDIDNQSEAISDFLIIAEYLNNFFSKILNEKISIRKDSVEIEAIFLPENFEQITGRVKVIDLKDFRNEEDVAIYHRQFKYLKPSNLAFVYGFPADYSSTGKAGAIITGALADRDQYETAHSYKRAMEIGSPLAFFPNARIAFQHLDDKWATIFKAENKIFLRAASKQEIDKRIQETKKSLSPKSVSGFIPDVWPEVDIIQCKAIKINLAHQAGRKSETLGRLINLFPNETETDSFSWSFAPYAKKRKFATVNEIPQIEFIKNVLESHDLSDHSERSKAAKKIYQSFDLNPLDTTTTYFEELWNSVVDIFGYSDIISQGFMIRLTMNLEDRPEISAAGVYSSLPVLPGTNKRKLAHIINELYKSTYSSKAIEIRELMNVNHIDTYAAVLFERMPDWKNPVLSGNFIINSENITGGFSMGHGIYLTDKGNKPPLLFSYSLGKKNTPISAQAGQDYKNIPQSDYKNPYSRAELTLVEKDILAHPEKHLDKQTLDIIINNAVLIRDTFGDKASWDIELTIEFEQGIQKIRIHQARPIVK